MGARARVFAWVLAKAPLLTAFLWILGAALLPLLLPFAAKRTYIDENALLAASADLSVRPQDVLRGQASLSQIRGTLDRGFGEGTTSLDVVEGDFRQLGMPHSVMGLGAARWVASGSFAAMYGGEAEAILFASRADDHGYAYVLALLSTLVRARWLSKDVIWVVAGPGVGLEEALGPWVRRYHTPTGSSRAQHAGTIQFAVVLDFPEPQWEAIDVRVIGSEGQLPNQDLLNLVYVLSRTARLPTNVEGFHRTRCPPRGVQSYLLCLSNFKAFALRQFRGVATGPHGAFGEFAIDAVSLRGVAHGNAPSGTGAARDKAAVELLEYIARSGSNLLEKLHHSLWLYSMLSAETFVGPDAYMAPLVCIFLSAVVKEISLIEALQKGAGKYRGGDAAVLALQLAILSVQALVFAVVLLSNWTTAYFMGVANFPVVLGMGWVHSLSRGRKAAVAALVLLGCGLFLVFEGTLLEMDGAGVPLEPTPSEKRRFTKAYWLAIPLVALGAAFREESKGSKEA